ncbi:MAG: Eco57I restriction-modification methylase domain-containing protein [Bacteroidaceae bacterium]|nr:Eco57I restriction-modification methylase domain-containing protein [Bacteroidaceae bacterium]
MNKKVFNQYIAESNFRELFIREMGWNNPKGQTTFEINIEEATYAFQQIADRSGFQVITCKVKETPTSAMCKKIDTRLRKMANDYICIYHIPQSEHHLWVVPVKKVEKRDLVLVEYETAEKANFLFEKVEDMCFDLDEHTTIMDVKERVQAGFIINSEKITKDFYTGFRKEHTNFAKYISGIDDEITDLKKNRNKQWYTSVMLNRLMFCYFIQKKGFLDRNVNYLRDKLIWVKKEKGEDRFYGTFYQGFLVSLFHDGLNSPRHQQDLVQKYGRIPYLNGGMFSIHELEEQYPELDIADEAFESLFSFFDQWHWHLDDRLTASGKDINPDVLGYIFEQYINDRAQMGAYYTKEDITEYIGRNTILPFLMDATKKMDEKPFKTNGAVWQFLRESGDTYIYDAVKKGNGLEIPEEIAVGIDTTKPNLLERRSHWNEKTPEAFALPTEIWRETIERLQRYASIKTKIENGEITEINDFITYNLDIRQFVQDLLAQTDDHLLVKHFYAQLRKVTILDPTCGSGAFLFAALNILEPLYEVCIDRMQGWNHENPNLFNPELEEINGKYRSNIRYFIYKNIILRNLYGVDIMVEATEIAKLRLFLKMVAVVDVNPREDNLGLDPLPDIDFNIRCGNMLVGYATEEDLENDLQYGDMFANLEFKDKVHTEMDIVAHAYDTFKKVQLEQSSDLETYRNAKQELKNRLKKLDELLNRKLYASTVSGGSLKYEDWLKSHQPFHWLAEYYDIINGNKGFDVIIGNPPYVSMAQIGYIKSSKEFKCSDLYGYVIRRVLTLKANSGYHGFIVMHNLAFSRNFVDVRNILKKEKGTKWFSFYSRIPSGLFSGDVRVRNCIYLLAPNGNSNFTSKLNRWFTEQRPVLFATLRYSDFQWNDVVPMLYLTELQALYESKKGKNIELLKDRNGHLMFFKKIAYNSLSVSHIEPPAHDLEHRSISQSELGDVKIDMQYFSFVWLLCIGKFYMSKWLTYGDDFHLTSRDIMDFTFPFESLSESDKAKLNTICEEVKKALPDTTQYKLNAGKYVGTFNTKKLWPLTDQSDRIFYKYMGGDVDSIHQMVESHIAACVLTDKGKTDEEGDELGEENNSNSQPEKPQPAKQRQKPVEQEPKPKDDMLTMIVRNETIERIKSGEKTTFKRYLDDEDFVKEVLVTENGKVKLSKDYCPYTAKNISSIKFVCDGESLVKAVTKISFRTGINQQGKTAWKIVFHF